MEQPPGGVHSCVDPATNLVAFSFTVPAGWLAQSNVQWNPQTPMNPVTPSARAQAPDGSAWMMLLPNGTFSWLDDGRLPEGSLQFGAPALRPRPTADVLTGLLFPSARGGVVDLRVAHVEPEPAPPWPSQLTQPVAPGDESIRATLEYSLQGWACRDVVSMVSHTAAPTPVPGGWGVEYVRYWSTYPALSVGAVVQRWADQEASLEAIRTSFRLEPRWIQTLQAMSQQPKSPVQQQAWFAAQQAAHREQVAMGDQLIQAGEAQSAAMDDIYRRYT